MGRPITPFVPGAAEEQIAGASLAACFSAILGTSGAGAGHVRGLSYTPPICQRSPMFALVPKLRKTRQRLNFLNIREVA